MIIQNIKPYSGQHCETTTTGTLLRQLDIELSEPMLFGLGVGLGYIFWNMKNMDFPFIGGRIKPDALTQNIAGSLHLELTVKETVSQQKAWEGVKQLLDEGNIVGLKLDCYHLEYFSRPFHFAAHYTAIYGYDETTAFLVDTMQQGVKAETSLISLALARAEKGPMSSRNLYYTLRKTNQGYDLKNAIKMAIRKNAQDYLNPPIANIGFKGIMKTSTEIIRWYRQSKNIENEFRSTALLMEKGGTGGALFRNFYRDFLKESYDLIKLEQLMTAYAAFVEIASLWSAVASLFDKTGQTSEFRYIQQASEILRIISVKEKNAMEVLTTI